MNRLLAWLVLTVAGVSVMRAADARRGPAHPVEVIVEFVVDAHGVPGRIRIIKSGGNAYDKSVVEAVSKWRLPKLAGTKTSVPVVFVDDLPPDKPANQRPPKPTGN